jgi:hypothetical protein
MATIEPVHLDIKADGADAHITVTYSLIGSASDIGSGQPYSELCRLIGDDTGINPPEDNTDDRILSGVLTPLFSTVVFPDDVPIGRSFMKTIPRPTLTRTSAPTRSGAW